MNARNRYLASKQAMEIEKARINNPVAVSFEKLQINRKGGLVVTQFKKKNFHILTGMERAGLYRSNSKGYAKNYNPNLTEGRTH